MEPIDAVLRERYPGIMANAEILRLNLPADLLQFVQDRVRSGRGNSAEDVVRDALELLRGQELPPTSMDYDQVRAQIEEGLEQARRGEVVDGEQAFDALEARLV